MTFVIEAAKSSGDLKDFLSFFAGGIAVLLPLLYAIWSFRRQKEHEIVYERYLKKGFDEILEVGERALNSHNCNWKHALAVCKTLRDAPALLVISDVDDSKFSPSIQAFPYAAASRIGYLLGSHAPWALVQSIAAFSGKSHEFCAIEVKKVVAGYLDSKLPGSASSEMAEDILGGLQALMNEADEFTVMLHKVGDIAVEFEVTRFGYGVIKKFKRRSRVKELISEIEEFLEARV